MKAPAFSIWSSMDVDLSPEDMVLALEDRGMTVCELSDEHGAELLKKPGTPEEIGAAFGAFAAEHGVSFPQGHLWLTVRLCDSSMDVVGILDKWLRLYAAIGVKNCVLHCDGNSFPEGTDRETILSANAEVLKKIVPTAEEVGVTICLENLRNIFHDAETLLDIIRRVGSPALGICLDTGHLNLYDRSADAQENFIRTAGSYLHALHIADNEGQQDQHMMPFGRGNVNFEGVMRGLAAVGYKDLFNYEIPGERRMPMPLRKAKAEYLKAVTEYLYSLI
ncbi:MAG: sugar phosphate isomerase/epimerase [Clostridia bacterium]|nr:sugar phosphate isomerase/epimerase [Clostridia bacterium]